MNFQYNKNAASKCLLTNDSLGPNEFLVVSLLAAYHSNEV